LEEFYNQTAIVNKSEEIKEFAQKFKIYFGRTSKPFRG